jgi:hypothetical protein
VKCSTLPLCSFSARSLVTPPTSPSPASPSLPRARSLGGNGYIGEYVVERLWRDAKLLEIGGGTVEAHEKNMTRDMAKMDRLN